MNTIDSLLINKFSSLKIEEKLEIKRLGPHRPLDFSMQQVDKNGKKRNFCKGWFENTEWLSVSINRKALYCFYCVLFNGSDSTWCTGGFTDLRHYVERRKMHQSSTSHMQCAINFKTFGKVNIMSQLNEGHALSIIRHNEQVNKNRHVLNKIIDILKFCGSHEIAIRGHNEKQTSKNRGIFLELVDMMAQTDHVLRDHLESSTVSKGTSKTIQNDLLNCIYDIYIKHVKNEIENVQYVAVQADDTTDISCNSQFVIVLRYLVNTAPVERFIKFVDVHDRSAVGLTNVLVSSLTI